jgi:hypothetical protein
MTVAKKQTELERAIGTKHHNEWLFATLKLKHISYIEVQFQGGGDSGEITDVLAYNSDHQPIDITDTNMLWRERTDSFDHEAKKWVVSLKDGCTTPLKNVISEVVNTLLTNTGIDWYNNDGGQGTFTMNSTTNPITANMTVEENITTTNSNSFAYEGII